MLYVSAPLSLSLTSSVNNNIPALHTFMHIATWLHIYIYIWYECICAHTCMSCMCIFVLCPVCSDFYVYIDRTHLSGPRQVDPEWSCELRGCIPCGAGARCEGFVRWSVRWSGWSGWLGWLDLLDLLDWLLGWSIGLDCWVRRLVGRWDDYFGLGWDWFVSWLVTVCYNTRWCLVAWLQVQFWGPGWGRAMGGVVHHDLFCFSWHPWALFEGWWLYKHEGLMFPMMVVYDIRASYGLMVAFELTLQSRRTSNRWPK